MDGQTTPPPVDAVGIHEAKTNLSKLVARAEAGDEIIIKRGGVPVAKLTAIAPQVGKRRLGIFEGQIEMADDFDDLPEDYLGEWRDG